jgi:hypothetical protein
VAFRRSRSNPQELFALLPRPSLCFRLFQFILAPNTWLHFLFIYHELPNLSGLRICRVVVSGCGNHALGSLRRQLASGPPEWYTPKPVPALPFEPSSVFFIEAVKRITNRVGFFYNFVEIDLA